MTRVFLTFVFIFMLDEDSEKEDKDEEVEEVTFTTANLFDLTEENGML